MHEQPHVLKGIGFRRRSGTVQESTEDRRGMRAKDAEGCRSAPIMLPPSATTSLQFTLLRYTSPLSHLNAETLSRLPSFLSTLALRRALTQAVKATQARSRCDLRLLQGTMVQEHDYEPLFSPILCSFMM